MALSQVQCLDDNHINLRTNESKPEFFYSEDQRLALETLIHAGQGAFEDYINTNNIRCFLSDLELERIVDTVEVYSPGSPESYAELRGENDGEEVSLQYWPDLSDRSIPQLDIGWPDRASYRGVTRVQVYTQPSYEGQSHIKEVVRKMIGQAQKVIAIVMDLFTDIDIFRDLLDASYRRKVAVYIMLETTGVKHFLRMCEKASMHTGHLKNLRVRSIRGTEFFSRTSKRVCGSQSQKFMFIDGDKAVSGSYSFTWSASRLDRNLITVLTGQAVDAFDTLFQDMYVLSNGVCLNKINLSSEPEPEYLPQAVLTLPPSATTALKLINPKYSLVSNCAFTTNGPLSDQTSAKNSTSKNQTDVIKQIRDTPVVPPVHPGLLNLEKANMINYVPTWPDPDPPSDVIGFINIRDSNKPLQAHLMRSELFEVSQAIRFKDPFHEQKESLSLRACPAPISQKNSGPEAPEDLTLLLEKPKTEHVKADKEELCATEKELDSKSLQRKNIHTTKDFPNTTSYFAQDNAVSDAEQSQHALQPLKCPDQTSDEVDLKSSTSAVSTKTHLDETLAIPDSPSVKQSQDDQGIPYVATQDYGDIKPKTDQSDWNSTQMSNCDSSISSLSDEYYECFSPVADLRSEGDVFVPEKTPVSLQNPVKTGNQEQDGLRSKSCSAQDCIDLNRNQNFFTPKLLNASCSIVFNFVSAEFKTTKTPSKTTFAQERDKGTIINDSKLSVNDRDFSQTPIGCLNFSSTSEEYFECNDTVGSKPEIDCMVNEPPSSVVDFNQNEPLQIPEPILGAEKLSELSCQNTTEKDEPKMDSGQVQSKFQYVLEMTSDSQVVTDDFKAVLEAKDNTQTQLDEKVHRHQDSEVTSEPTAESESMSNVLQGHKTSASQHYLELQAKASSVELAEVVPMQDLQLDVSLDLACEESEKESLQDLQHDASLDSTCGKPVLLAEVNSKLHFETEVSGDAVCKGQSVTLTEKTTKPEVSPDIIRKPSGVTAILQSETNSECSALQEKADVTPSILAELEVTKSIELPKTEELQNKLTHLDSRSNHPPNLKPEEHVNEQLRLQNESNEVNPAVLKRNYEEHNPKEKQFENVELLILEDSDLRQMELSHSDTVQPIAAPSKETKLSKTESIEPKTTHELKLKENKLGHNVYSRNGKKTCHPTALVEEKQEGEHICANQMYVNLPEAKPKMECLARKQPYQASSRIPIQARRGLPNLPISKPDTRNRSLGLRPPKASTHGFPHGKPLGQNKPSIPLSPSPEKLSTEGIASVRSTQIPQRPTSTVPAPRSPTSPTKRPQVQLTVPKIRQSDQPNVSRKRSASITKYNCSTSRMLWPAQDKKQEFKGSSKQLE